MKRCKMEAIASQLELLKVLDQDTRSKAEVDRVLTSGKESVIVRTPGGREAGDSKWLRS